MPQLNSTPIIVYCLLITDYCSLVIDWCNSVANNAINHMNYPHIRSIFPFALFAYLLIANLPQMPIIAGFLGCSSFPETTPKLHRKRPGTRVEQLWNTWKSVIHLSSFPP